MLCVGHSIGGVLAKDLTQKGRALALQEDARMRAEYFERGGFVHRYPLGTCGPHHSEFKSSWGISMMKRARWRKHHEKRKADKQE